MHRISCALALALASGCSVAAAPQRPAHQQQALSSNPIAAENLLPGNPDWKLSWWAGPHVLEGYAGAASVNHGESIDIHASADGDHGLTWDLYRMGYYGGAGARKVASGSASVHAQAVPAPDPTTGLVACDWPVSFTIKTDASWTSGVYLVRLTRDDGPQQFATFVL